MTNGADPLVVGVLHPPDLDVGALEDLTISGERPLDIRIVEYADPARMRQEKAAGMAADELLSGEPSLGPARRDDLDPPRFCSPSMRPSTCSRWPRGFGGCRPSGPG